MRGFLKLPAFVGVLAAIAWLALANHCALGLAMVESHGAEAVTAGDCCASEIPSPPSPAKKSSPPCCKILRIVSVAPAETPSLNLRPLPGVPGDGLATTIPIAPPLLAVDYFYIDSGPPGGSFAGTVLQRSLPAHAPPSLS
jgi:hypothetical protein